MAPQDRESTSLKPQRKRHDGTHATKGGFSPGLLIDQYRPVREERGTRGEEYLRMSTPATVREERR